MPHPNSNLLYRSPALATVVLLAAWLAPAALAQQKSTANAPDDTIRLFQRFIEDGAIAPHVWIEGQGRLQTNLPIFTGDEGEKRIGQAILGLGLTEDLEVGLIVGLVNLDPDNSGSQSGLDDIQIYAKYRVAELPLSVTLGGLLKIPTADQDEGLGTGEIDIEAFVGLRKDYDHVHLIGHGGVRFNKDPDVPGNINGRTSILLGGGVIIAMSPRLFNSWELTFESKRFKGGDSMTMLTPGLMWRMGDRGLIRAGIGIGLTDGAPDFEAIGGLALTY
ncbi:MAG: hypothetical protein V3U98_06590 [Acidobacteriota bacterium]